jgi:hypothetical protein
MAEKNEPQSYGSQGEWVTGKTGEKVNSQKGPANSQHADFYSEHRENDDSAPHQGGHVSPVQAAENAAPGGEPQDAGHKTTVKESGAKRGGYFKDRDYT